MPNIYVRATALPNVKGRVDYITSPNRQEKLLASFDSTTELLDGKFWHTLSKESQAAFEMHGQKTRTVRTKDGRMIEKELECTEGRELMIMLSNHLLKRMTPDQIVETLAKEFKTELGIDNVAIGLHLKHDKNGPDNLHAHVVFPERELLLEPTGKIAERNLFFDANGKRCYKKSEILDADKQLLPGCKIIKKGELYEQRHFGNVDTKYSSKSWLRSVKTDFVLPLRNGKLRGDVRVTEYNKRSGKLPQQHVGNAVSKAAPAKAERIRQHNEDVRQYNKAVDAALANGDLTIAELTQAKEEIYVRRAAEMRFRRALQEEEEKKERQIKMERAYYYARYHTSKRQIEKNTTLYDKYGRKRTTVELIVILAMTIAKQKTFDHEKHVEVKTSEGPKFVCYRDPKIQGMIDAITRARGGIPYSERLLAEKSKPAELPAYSQANSLEDLINQGKSKKLPAGSEGAERDVGTLEPDR